MSTIQVATITGAANVVGNVAFSNTVTFKAGIFDSTGTQGSAGQVLASNGQNNVYWTTVGGYTLFGSTAKTTVANTTTYYFGGFPGLAASTTQDQFRIYIPQSGNVVNVTTTLNVNGTLDTGSNTGNVYIIVNNTTSTYLGQIAATNRINVLSNTTVNFAITAGNYYELYYVAPQYGTLPTNVYLSATVFIR